MGQPKRNFYNLISTFEYKFSFKQDAFTIKFLSIFFLFFHYWIITSLGHISVFWHWQIQKKKLWCATGEENKMQASAVHNGVIVFLKSYLKSHLGQSRLYGRVTKKYDIYRNNNKKNPGYFGKCETVGTNFFFYEVFFLCLD